MHAENKQTNKKKPPNTQPIGEALQVAPSKAAFVLFKAEEGWEADQAKAFPS